MTAADIYIPTVVHTLQLEPDITLFSPPSLFILAGVCSYDIISVSFIFEKQKKYMTCNLHVSFIKHKYRF